MKTNSLPITIIGGGLTGLTLGFYLKKKGLNVLILEKADRVGGVIHTEKSNGFTFEIGPNTGVLSTPELVELFDDLKDKVELAIADPASKFRWILKGGQWHPLPYNFTSAVTTPLFTLKDKFRILGEPFRKPGTNPDETVAELVKRRMGNSWLDFAIDPFISGIYAGDPNKLVTRYALPKLYNLEQNYGSFIKGAIKKRKEPKTDSEKRATKEVFSVKGGLINLVNALKDSIGEENIHCGVSDLKISQIDNRYMASFTDKHHDYHEIVSDKVITTINGNKLKEILSFVDEELFRPILNLNYAQVVQAIACYKEWKGKKLNAFGGLIPTLENRDALGILFPSSLFNDRAPEGGAILSIFMGGTKRPDMFEKPNEKLKKLALKEVRETLGQTESPDEIRIYRYKRAIPQYEVNSGERFEAINKIEDKYPGLILAGNIRDGIGIADRVKQARQIADSLAEMDNNQAINEKKLVMS